jgi:tRNA pseudouridine38-40 synthase
MNTLTYKLILSYDGTDYFGYQKQPSLITIQFVLEQALFKITKKNIFTFAASRTDKGVHALGQVVHFKINFYIDPLILTKCLNKILPSSIKIIHISKVNNDFHSRYDAKSKIYKYVFSKQELTPFNCRFQVYFDNLDYNLISQAIHLLEGINNFILFTNNKDKKKTTIRHIIKTFTKENKTQFFLFFHGKSFLKQMILFLVGFLIKIGQRKKNILDLKKMLNLQIKKKLPFLAPSGGLCLEKIFY